MKRKDIEVGGEYATDTGLHVRVEDLAPGWSIDPGTGDWVEHKALAKRFIKGRGYVEYQTSIALKAVEVTSGRKCVVEPRHLLGPWSDYAAEYAVQQQRQELVNANAEALLLRASMAGVEPRVDPQRQEVVLTFDAMDTLLRRARV